MFGWLRGRRAARRKRWNGRFLTPKETEELIRRWGGSFIVGGYHVPPSLHEKLSRHARKARQARRGGHT